MKKRHVHDKELARFATKMDLVWIVAILFFLAFSESRAAEDLEFCTTSQEVSKAIDYSIVQLMADLVTARKSENGEKTLRIMEEIQSLIEAGAPFRKKAVEKGCKWVTGQLEKS